MRGIHRKRLSWRQPVRWTVRESSYNRLVIGHAVDPAAGAPKGTGIDHVDIATGKQDLELRLCRGVGFVVPKGHGRNEPIADVPSQPLPAEAGSVQCD